MFQHAQHCPLSYCCKSFSCKTGSIESACEFPYVAVHSYANSIVSSELLEQGRHGGLKIRDCVITSVYLSVLFTVFMILARCTGVGGPRMYIIETRDIPMTNHCMNVLTEFVKCSP